MNGGGILQPPRGGRSLPPRAAPGALSRWTLDPAFSAVEFTVPHLGIGYLRGRFEDVELVFDYQADTPERARLELSIGPEIPGPGERDRAWMPVAADVFSVRGFGAIHFASDRVDPLGATRLAARGNLTIRGVACPVVVELVVRGEVTDSDNVQRMGVSGSLLFNRRQFGIRWPDAQDASLGDEMRISLDAELIRSDEPLTAA